MAMLTLREAARVLGVKPSKVRLYVSQRKLAAHAAPPSAGRHGPAQVLLDADEVETLARVRAHKRRVDEAEPVALESPEPSLRPMVEQAAASGSAVPLPAAEPDTAPANPHAGGAGDAASSRVRSEALLGDVESASLEGELVGWRGAALVQAVLAPLVAELHDARDVIRRQAEELGALRATVAELERRTALANSAAAGASVAAPLSRNGSSPDHDRLSAPAAPVKGGGDASAAASSAPAAAPPLWRRALAYALRS